MRTILMSLVAMIVFSATLSVGTAHWADAYSGASCTDEQYAILKIDAAANSQIEYACVADCTVFPNFLQAGSSDNVCIGHCPLNEGGTCLDTCPSQFPVRDGDLCVAACPSDKSFIDTATQTNDEHPTNDPITTTFDKCVASCPIDKKIDGNRCVDACPTEKPLETTDSQCVAVCPDVTPFTSGTMCVASCPTDQKIDGNQCVDACPSEKPLVTTDSQCVAVCPDVTPFTSGTMCVASCPTGEGPDSNNVCTVITTENACQIGPGGGDIPEPRVMAAGVDTSDVYPIGIDANNLSHIVGVNTEVDPEYQTVRSVEASFTVNSCNSGLTAIFLSPGGTTVDMSETACTNGAATYSLPSTPSDAYCGETSSGQWRFHLTAGSQNVQITDWRIVLNFPEQPLETANSMTSLKSNAPDDGAAKASASSSSDNPECTPAKTQNLEERISHLETRIADTTTERDNTPDDKQKRIDKLTEKINKLTDRKQVLENRLNMCFSN